ncbi:MAG: hypothetical protein JWN13_1164 [Betaproteobacteria bacterium]|nr:hypothetical protein [Betaproteobacteria bacterium]
MRSALLVSFTSGNSSASRARCPLPNLRAAGIRCVLLPVNANRSARAPQKFNPDGFVANRSTLSTISCFAHFESPQPLSVIQRPGSRSL